MIFFKSWLLTARSKDLVENGVSIEFLVDDPCLNESMLFVILEHAVVESQGAQKGNQSAQCFMLSFEHAVVEISGSTERKSISAFLFVDLRLRKNIFSE